ncbi:MAG: N-acetyltransferase [Flavipsychrobacter sp.]|nr:N-acetyltransferase [Flavipsychrobacter sp.]
MEIQHQDDGKKGRYYIADNGEQLAEMTYVWVGEDKFIIDHTEVDERLKGQGVGLKLVKAAVEMARERKVGIIPLCPFAKSVFDKKEEFRDVLAANPR